MIMQFTFFCSLLADARTQIINKCFPIVMKHIPCTQVTKLTYVAHYNKESQLKDVEPDVRLYVISRAQIWCFP
jgi:hypothetical protein